MIRRVMDIKPNPELVAVLLEAYAPCKNFGVCKEAEWAPKEGLMPRGFLGATSELKDVEVVMIFAEPGHPHGTESYDNDDPLKLMMRGIEHTYDCFANGTDLFHQNTRWFLSQLYPQMSFDEQLKHVWMTEGRLCSIKNEIGNVRDRTCANHYLIRQLELLPNATIVAFGGKAKDYMRQIKQQWIGAYALSPPGANHKPARPSWKVAIEEIINKRT